MVGRPWQEPETPTEASGRKSCTWRSTPSVAARDRRSDFDGDGLDGAGVYGDWEEVREHASRTSVSVG